MPLAANDIIQMTVGGLKDVQNVLNIFYFRCTTPASTGTAAENLSTLIDHLWDDAVGTWYSVWLNLMPNDYTLQFIRMQVVAPTRQAYVEELQVFDGFIDVDPIQTANLSWVFLKQSALAGRRGVGPTHMLVPSMQWAQNGNLTAVNQAERTALMTLVPQVVTVAAGGVYEPVIYHPGFSPNFTRITHCTQKNEIRTMSRRTVGRGI